MSVANWIEILAVFVAVTIVVIAFGGLRAGSPVRRALRQPSFAVAAAVLLVSAATLTGATKLMSLHFKKLPVELRKPVDTVPARLGPWMQVSKDQALSKEFVDVLGTEKYFFRDYLDTRLIDEPTMQRLQNATDQERFALLDAIRKAHPQAIVNFAVTYYTGMVDTVAHIPDRCYIADGFQPSQYDLVKWPAFAGRGESAAARFINFEDQAGRSKALITRNVAYFFHVNGRYESDPIGVRVSLQDLFQRYGYYAKIELMTLLDDRAKAAEVMNDFLTHALPAVEECLPDWNKVIAGPVE
jgi:hypothetical protein